MSKQKKISVLSLAVGLALVTCMSAHADSFVEVENAPTMIGLGVASVPDFRGSSNQKTVPVPLFRYTFAGQERYIQVMGNEATLNLIDSAQFHVGPILSFQGKRDSDVDDPAVQRMVPIDSTVEGGIFGDMIWRDPSNPQHNRFVLGAALLTDLGSESDGTRFRLGARWWHAITPTIDLNIGGGFIYADNKWNNHYFGVNSENVGTSGIPFHTADGGINEYYLTLGGLMALNKNWTLAAGLRVSTLAGDAKDSPIVSQHGDSTQVAGGLGIIYMWR